MTLLIYIAAHSSPRIGRYGVKALRVNPLHKSVTVAAQITEVPDTARGPSRTSSNKRSVRIPDVIAAMLEDYLHRRSELGADGRVVLSARGSSVAPDLDGWQQPLTNTAELR